MINTASTRHLSNGRVRYSMVRAKVGYPENTKKSHRFSESFPAPGDVSAEF